MKLIFPGSFDLFHNGHYDAIKYASEISDHVVVLVLNNIKKDESYWFNINERYKIAKKCLSNLKNVEVLLQNKNDKIEDICHMLKIFNVFRGVKSSRTLDEEIRLKNITTYMAKLKYNEEIKFIYHITSDSDFRGSSIVKSYANDKKILKTLVPKESLDDIYNRSMERKKI